MQAEMATYVTKTRPAFTNPGVGQLLVNDDRDAFPEGTIGKRLVAFFQKSGVTSTHVGHTHLRKFIPTQTYQQGNQDEGYTVEKVMSHGTTTRQCCYVRADCTKMASKAMKVIARVTGGSSIETSPRRLAAASTTQPLSASVEITIMASSSANMPLTEDQKLAISEVFADQLAKNICLTQSMVCNKMLTNSTLRDMASCSYSVKSHQLPLPPAAEEPRAPSPTFQHHLHLHTCWKVGEHTRRDSIKIICQGGLDHQRHCHHNGSPQDIPNMSKQDNHPRTL